MEKSWQWLSPGQRCVGVGGRGEGGVSGPCSWPKWGTVVRGPDAGGTPGHSTERTAQTPTLHTEPPTFSAALNTSPEGVTRATQLTDSGPRPCCPRVWVDRFLAGPWLHHPGQKSHFTHPSNKMNLPSHSGLRASR